MRREAKGAIQGVALVSWRFIQRSVAYVTSLFFVFYTHCPFTEQNHGKLLLQPLRISLPCQQLTDIHSDGDTVHRFCSVPDSPPINRRNRPSLPGPELQAFFDDREYIPASSVQRFCRLIYALTSCSNTGASFTKHVCSYSIPCQ